MRTSGSRPASASERRADVDRLQAQLRGEREPVRVDVGDGDAVGAVGPRDLGGDDADRPGAGHQHAGAGRDSGATARPDADRQRFEQPGGVVADGVGHGEHELGGHDEVLAEGAVVGRGGEEPHVGAQVVAAGQALPSSGGRAHRARSRPADRGCSVLTSGPTATTTPPASCPRTRGRRPRTGRSGRARSSARRNRRPRPTRSRPAPHRARGGDLALFDADVTGLAQHADLHRRHDNTSPVRVVCPDANPRRSPADRDHGSNSVVSGSCRASASSSVASFASVRAAARLTR